MKNINDRGNIDETREILTDARLMKRLKKAQTEVKIGRLMSLKDIERKLEIK